MSQENVDVIRRLFEAFNGGDKETADEQLDPDVEMQDYPLLPDAEWHRGHDGATRWARKIWETAGRFTLDASEFLEVDDGRLVVPTRVTAEGRKAQVPLSFDATALCTLREGKVTRLEIFPTKAEALEAAGLSE